MLVPKLPKLNRHRTISGLQYIILDSSLFLVSVSAVMELVRGYLEDPSLDFHLCKYVSLLFSTSSKWM